MAPQKWNHSLKKEDRCNNHSKCGLLQRFSSVNAGQRVVITTQNVVFDNCTCPETGNPDVVITTQNVVFYN